MKKITILLLMLYSSLAFAQQPEPTDVTAKSEIKSTTPVSATDKQKDVKEKWLQSKDRPQSASSDKARKQADKKYEQLAYMAAAEKYKLLDANEAADRVVISRMANAYRLNGHSKEAEYWYAQAVNKTETPIDILHYAQVLQSNGKCEDAARWFKKYNEIRPDDDKYPVAAVTDCDINKEIETHKDVVLENFQQINTEHLDFCATPYKCGLVFTSTRASNKIAKNKDSWSNDNFCDLYYAELGDGKKVKNIQLMQGDLNGKYHDGVATFDNSQSVMMFSRNNQKGKSKEGLVDLKIYMAYNFDSYWSEVKELPFNSDEYATSHPSLSSDGNRIYFASDRPGGFGGMDIYASTFDGAKWSTPINLGPTVNSAGNELFPAIASDNTLYFSSDGHLGLGGSDIFFSTKSDIEDEESWSSRENMGQPFNSPKDDFGFSINSENNAGYLSSNREGGKGGDDVYYWSGPLNDKNAPVKKLICVLDQETQQLVKNASVVIFEKDNSDKEHGAAIKEMNTLSDSKQAEVLDRLNNDQEYQTFQTDEEGQFLFAAKPGVTYSIRIDADSYELKNLEVAANYLISESQYCVEINKSRCQQFSILVVDKVMRKPLPGSTVTFVNNCTGERTQSTTRADGTIAACFDCGCTYGVEAAKELFEADQKTIIVSTDKCGKGTVEETVLELRSISNTPDPVVAVAEESPQQKALKQHFLNNSNGQFYVGQIITIQDIYYDYDKWDIRSDAKPRLDKITELLNLYPGMEIEMMSHTDARGKSAYNSTLSEKRANSVMNYVSQQGIQSSRLTSRGYGEMQLTNRCADGVNCSDDEHQQNRRTEIRIRKL